MLSLQDYQKTHKIFDMSVNFNTFRCSAKVYLSNHEFPTEDQLTEKGNVDLVFSVSEDGRYNLDGFCDDEITLEIYDTILKHYQKADWKKHGFIVLWPKSSLSCHSYGYQFLKFEQEKDALTFLVHILSLQSYSKSCE
jgi:hypothetical protein